MVPEHPAPAGLACPFCAAPLAAAGPVRCARCRRRFEAFPTTHARRTLPIPPPPLPASPDAPACALHAGNRALSTCERCGDFMCGLCGTLTEGRLYCPRCFETLFERGSLEVAQVGFRTPGAALGFSIAALVMVLAVCVGPGLAVVGIVLGGRALQQIGKQPALPGRGKAIAAIIIGVLALVAGIALTVGLVIAGGDE